MVQFCVRALKVLKSRSPGDLLIIIIMLLLGKILKKVILQA